MLCYEHRYNRFRLMRSERVEQAKEIRKEDQNRMIVFLINLEHYGMAGKDRYH